MLITMSISKFAISIDDGILKCTEIIKDYFVRNALSEINFKRGSLKKFSFKSSQTKLNFLKILLRITESADILNGIKWLKLTTIYYKLKAQTELFSAFHTKKKTFMKASERIFI